MGVKCVQVIKEDTGDGERDNVWRDCVDEVIIERRWLD